MKTVQAWVALSVIALAAPSFAQQLSNSREVQSFKAFTTRLGGSVIIARVQGKKEAVVQFIATDTDLDGQILRVALEKRDGVEEFVTKELTGARQVLLTRKQDTLQLHASGNEVVPLIFSDAYTREINLHHFWRQYDAAEEERAQAARRK